MAGTKRISALPEMAADTLHEDDIFPVVDMSEATVANKTKHIKAKNVLRAFDPVKARFKTVALFLADNNSVIGYSGSGARVIVADGDIIEAGGFRYSIRPTGASDNHVVTAGGVKLDVLAGDNGFNVKAFGAVGDGVADDTSKIQTALDILEGTATQIYIPAGTYRLTSGLVYNEASYGKGLQLTGDGLYETVLKMDANSQIILTIKHTSGGGGENYTSHGRVANIGLQQFSGRTGVTGMRISNCWYYTFENIDASNLTNSGIETYAATPGGDTDIVVLCTFKGLRCKGNTGSGFKVNAASGAVGLSQSRFEFCDFSGNTVDGFTLSNFDGVEFFKCLMLDNGTSTTGNGITVAHNGIFNRNLVLRGCEIGNGNKRAGLQLNNILGVLSEQNRWVQNDGEAGQYLIEFVSGSTVRNFTDKNSFIIVGNAITPLTAYLGTGATISDIRIENPFYSLFDTSNKTKYSFSSPYDVIIVEDKATRGEAPGINVVTDTSPYTPDAFMYKHHVMRLITNTTQDINAPTNPVGGREIVLHVVNFTAGAITVNFNSVYRNGTFSAPATNKRASATFVYDPVSLYWIQVGEWATDVAV